MALGNITWRFQNPVDFGTTISKNLENNRRLWKEMSTNLGEGTQKLHDYMLDRELADMIDSHEEQGRIDAANTELFNTEAVKIKQEIESLKAQRANLQSQLAQLENVSEIQSDAQYDKRFETGRLLGKTPELGSTGGKEYGF